MDIGALEAAHAANPDDWQRLYLLAEAHWSAGRPDRALEVVRAALVRTPSFAFALNYAGWLLVFSEAALLEEGG